MPANSSQEIILRNLYVELNRDKNGKTYFTIHDKDTSIAYFVFPYRVKGWSDLAAKWAKAKEIHLQFGERKKVIALKILKLYLRFPIGML